MSIDSESKHRGAASRVAWIVALLCLLGFGWLAYAVKQGQLDSFDSDWIGRLQGSETAAMTRTMNVFTAFGSTIPVVVMAGIVLLALLVRRRWREAALVAVAEGGSYAANGWVKDLFARERPSLHRLVEESGYGFPSGHTLAALCFYGALAYVLWGLTRSVGLRAALAAVAAALTLLTGISRVYLGVHYPSDIVGAILFGGFWLAGCAGVYRWSLARRRRRRTAADRGAGASSSIG